MVPSCSSFGLALPGLVTPCHTNLWAMAVVFAVIGRWDESQDFFSIFSSFATPESSPALSDLTTQIIPQLPHRDGFGVIDDQDLRIAYRVFGDSVALVIAPLPFKRRQLGSLLKRIEARFYEEDHTEESTQELLEEELERCNSRRERLSSRARESLRNVRNTLSADSALILSQEREFEPLLEAEQLSLPSSPEDPLFSRNLIDDRTRSRCRCCCLALVMVGIFLLLLLLVVFVVYSLTCYFTAGTINPKSCFNPTPNWE